MGNQNEILDQSIYEAVINASHDAIVIVDADSQVFFWNESAEKLFGYSSDFMVGKNMHSYITPDRHRAISHVAFKKFQESGEGRALGRMVEIEALRQDGVEIWVELSLTAFEVEGKRWAFAIIRDITEKKRLEIELQEEASTDALTGLSNRREFQRQLESHLDHPMSMAIIDIDHFKQINDGYGHLIGDEAIQMVAGCLTDMFSDAISVARLGGEEFGVLFSSDDIDLVFNFCEEFRILLSRQRFSEHDLSLTVSIGVSGYKSTARGMFYAADVALYEAKAGGRNRVCLAQRG
ncbi:sensor domain-containing diguanylate cyclase [Thiomicrorhabdus sp. ZW0627]|uniref:sensor domain-containing diguanylate cyclase n=1 Tax=Thiomicrorhabdus sp. ZW0627 TaxID=3039774 RepID=UPI002436854D|nr:sensor domain-containing diguanylate cyclase [Thiomicrorhabdus sp. ZW0627]MDG6773098.1 sensor domain-containing diguanylate cyclase [Thiomicrorhabdus sp. ZW0627]